MVIRRSGRDVAVASVFDRKAVDRPSVGSAT